MRFADQVKLNPSSKKSNLRDGIPNGSTPPLPQGIGKGSLAQRIGPVCSGTPLLQQTGAVFSLANEELVLPS